MEKIFCTQPHTTPHEIQMKARLARLSVSKTEIKKVEKGDEYALSVYILIFISQLTRTNTSTHADNGFTYTSRMDNIICLCRMNMKNHHAILRQMCKTKIMEWMFTD